jgi:hypothetical protein
VDRRQLTGLGDVRTPSIADLFIGIMSNHMAQAQGAAK